VHARAKRLIIAKGSMNDQIMQKHIEIPKLRKTGCPSVLRKINTSFKDRHLVLMEHRGNFTTQENDVYNKNGCKTFQR
jgi:hypothetical protein